MIDYIRNFKYMESENNMKEEFIELLKQTNRDGIDKLLNWLEKSDFYKAPASTRFHGSYEGGLLEHSLNVYKCLKLKLSQEPYSKALTISEDTLIIISLLHDICKANYYTIEMRNKKNADGVWVKEPYYTVDDTIPYGHGEKSVMMINKFIELSMEEMYAIRWHMGFSEPKELHNTLSLVFEKYPLVLALHSADMEATYLLENRS